VRSIIIAVASVTLAAASASAQILSEVSASHGERANLAFPRIGGYEVLVGDFHVHTTHSDGVLPTRERVLEAYLNGYTALAITDHGNVEAYAEAKPLADALGIVLLRGVESGVNREQHWVFLGFGDDYTPRNAHNLAATPEEAETTGRTYYRDELKKIADDGGLAFYPHPHYGWREPEEWARRKGILVGVEVLNSCTDSGWGGEQWLGRWCYPFAFDWALEKDLTILANSDIHEAHKDAFPRARTLVLVKERTPEGVLDAIRAGRTLAGFPDGGEKWDSPEMLWAKAGVASRYVLDVVKVEPRELDEGIPASGLVLRNVGAVPLGARVCVDDGRTTELVLKQGSEYLIHAPGGAKRVSVEWLNVYTRRDRTLRTEYVMK